MSACKECQKETRRLVQCEHCKWDLCMTCGLEHECSLRSDTFQQEEPQQQPSSNDDDLFDNVLIRPLAPVDAQMLRHTREQTVLMEISGIVAQGLADLRNTAAVTDADASRVAQMFRRAADMLDNLRVAPPSAFD